MRVLRSAVILLTAMLTAASGAAQAPPAEPVSINLEEIAYPHPVSFLMLKLYGEDLRMAYMDVRPAEAGDRGAVVLLHGMNFFGEYWSDTIDILRDEGFRVIVPDQIGFGRSSKPIIPYTLHDMAANTAALLEHLGVGRAAIVGHSMGGLVAARFAFSYPEKTSHLALVNAIGMEDARLRRPWRDTEDVYQANLARSYAAIRQNFERYFVEWNPEYEKYIRIHFGWTRSGDWPRLARIRAHLQQMIYMDPVVYDWPHIEARTLVIGGEEDGPDFPELARKAASTIPGAALVLLPAVGHNPFAEAPDLFFPPLIEFLKS